LAAAGVGDDYIVTACFGRSECAAVCARNVHTVLAPLKAIIAGRLAGNIPGRDVKGSGTARAGGNSTSNSTGDARRHAVEAIDIGRARVRYVPDCGVFRAGDDGVAAQSNADAELVKQGAVVGVDDRLLVPHIYIASEYIGAAITSRAGKYARPEVRRPDDYRVALDGDALSELILKDAIAGDELLLPSPVSVLVANEDVGRARVRSFCIVVQWCADDNRVTADGGALTELVTRRTLARIRTQRLAVLKRWGTNKNIR
jgi:hypothetical protein